MAEEKLKKSKKEKKEKKEKKRERESEDAEGVKSKKKDQKKQKTETTETTETTEKKSKKDKKDKKKEKKEKKSEKKEKKEKTEKKSDKKDKKDKKDKTPEKKSEKKSEAKAVQNNGNLSAETVAYRAKEEIHLDGPCQPEPVLRFQDAPFNAEILKGLKAVEFDKPSPIQAQAWPIAVTGVDMVAVAKTGSGKTLGFLVPAFEYILSKATGKGPHALVLAPTRELVSQIHAEVSKVPTTVRSCVVYGGVPKHTQIQQLKDGPGLVVATPGRLNDLMNGNSANLSNVRFLVMDEADRMLDMGFEPQIKSIIAALASDHQTLFFTATWPKSVQKMAAKYLKSGAELSHLTVGSLEELVANKDVSQEFYELDDSEKDQQLWKLIDNFPDGSKVVTFANTKRRVDHLYNACWKAGFGASAIHGDKTQEEREKGLKQFTNGEWPLMFATDVAARGLDIKNVTHVVNYDMPRDVENYIHRIGRTGRAGKTGAAITFWNKAFDVPCAPALSKIASEAGQKVPDWLINWAKRAKDQKADKNWKY